MFEHAGGWEMGANFANFFGTPPDGWYMMGVAAGKMTKSNKLGFVAAFPLGWTSTFINAFTLGAKSVNPDVQTIVAYTFAWGDRAKEADTTNSLINQGVDVITMHVDSPSTVISTAESRGVYSIGYQNLAAQQFAPEYWISGTGFTLGGKLTWLPPPCSMEPGNRSSCAAALRMAAWRSRPSVPKSHRKCRILSCRPRPILKPARSWSSQGPIKDQDGNVKVAEGEVLTDDAMGSVDWFVEGVIGSPK